ncbi:MAG: glycosyltransferase family 4 protein [Gloeomargarita sp. SKYBB_i_bin120]|nr:glycosyltransferase family 4 protein [Gloeomargarita sp. SKYG98]MCS7291422.1 glycosyltransferase family 4 protein [Gloeomargarita sp. SKYB120]MDW8176982.1 glycosyltransferase family 4 protein [Gloeomargarita sp. SKYBB_i_bin120]
MHLLVFNLATDAQHPLLGFTTLWLNKLAEKVASIQVITMQAGVLQLHDNIQVYSLGKELGYSEPHRAVRFYRFLFEILRRQPIDLCFSHMTPLFTNLAAPILKMHRIPIVTWYAHPSLTNRLKLAHFWSDRMLTSFPTTYPYRHDQKLVVVGQGIDTDLFRPATVTENSPEKALILAVGRLSPVKDYGTLIAAVAQLVGQFPSSLSVLIVGNPTNDQDQQYVTSLRAQVRQLHLEHVVRFQPAVSLQELPAIYQQCTVHVNLTPTGFGDKVALEAMACGKVCLVANPGFRETLGMYADQLLFAHANPQDLAQKLQAVLALPATERQAIGGYLRQQVVRLHSLDRLTDHLVHLFAELCAAKR